MIWCYEKVMFDFNLVLSISLSFKFSLSLLFSIIKLLSSWFESDFDFISAELFLVDSCQWIMYANCLFLPLNLIFLFYTLNSLPVLLVILMSVLLKPLIRTKDVKSALIFFLSQAKETIVWFFEFELLILFSLQLSSGVNC